MLCDKIYSLYQMKFCVLCFLSNGNVLKAESVKFLCFKIY